jgi:hypothetical protein
VAVGIGEIGSGTTTSIGTNAAATGSQSPLLGLKATVVVAGVVAIAAAWLTAHRIQVDRNLSPTRAVAPTTASSRLQPTAASRPTEPSTRQTAPPSPQIQPVAAPTATSRASVDPPAAAARQTRSRKPAAVAASVSPAAVSGAAEVELITRAQALLDSQPSAALTALDDHERLYPGGMLREERETLRIDAEWALGRHSVALSRARAFVQRYPHSTQTRRFDQLLSDHKNETGATRTE